MSETIEYSMFSNVFKNSKTFETEKFGTITFSWNIEKVSQRKFLRYKIEEIEDIFEVEYDVILTESDTKTLEEYFLNVIKLLAYQVVLLKEGEYDADIHEDDLKFLRYFENKYDKKHTQGNFK